MGEIAEAMAYRVKYRKVNSAGQAKKILLRIENLGCHMKNRGGVYPAGCRCKSLCLEVVLAARALHEAGWLEVAGY